MGKSNYLENAWLLLFFNGTPIANIADNAASAPLASHYVSLHTADPGEGGNQTTNEAAYPGYARVAVARTAGGWVVVNNSASPVASITFPAATGGGETETHFVVGTDASGAGRIGYSGTITPNIVVSNGVTPILTPASAISED